MGSFKDVVGHRDVIQYLQNAVAENRVSQAYIVNGERGTGKKMLAKLFAMALLCEEHGPEPCNKCHSCVQAESNNHPDIIWVTHEKPGSIGVDDVRTQINNTVAIKPYQGPYKVYIIPEADIKKYLMERMEVPDYKAEVCAAFAQGNLGKAIKLAGSEHFNELKDEVLNLMRHINEMDISELVEAVKRCTLYKVEINDYLDLIMVWYRDVLLYKATREIDKVVFKDQIDCMREQARRSSYEGIETILDSLDKAKARLKANVNFDLVMELLFLTIKEN